jgi:hypothetical protein
VAGARTCVSGRRVSREAATTVRGSDEMSSGDPGARRGPPRTQFPFNLTNSRHPSIPTRFQSTPRPPRA